MTNTEKQEAYRNRKYAEGYKQVRLWVPRDSEGKDVKEVRRVFIARLDELTAGWSKTRISKLCKELLALIKTRSKEVTKKQ
ncbi:MAG: hypothetical protein LBC31_02465 [Treponema sp.]|jgi:hypothetical protein|nr:hypothetical protein [Treponema sp.]